jgi:hypothetical protein
MKEAMRKTNAGFRRITVKGHKFAVRAGGAVGAAARVATKKVASAGKSVGRFVSKNKGPIAVGTGAVIGGRIGARVSKKHPYAGQLAGTAVGGFGTMAALHPKSRAFLISSGNKLIAHGKALHAHAGLKVAGMKPKIAAGLAKAKSLLKRAPKV